MENISRRYFKIVGLLIIVISFFSCKEKNNNTRFDLSSLSFINGDLILRKGTSINSRVVLMSKTNESYSHVGIIVKTDSIAYVVHTSPDEVSVEEGSILRKELLTDFLAKNKAVAMAIYRYDLTELDKEVLLEKINYFLNKKILFDNDYDINDSSKFYCTEFVWNCYNAIDIDISESKRTIFPGIKKEFIFPSDIIQNKNLQLIYKFP